MLEDGNVRGPTVVDYAQVFQGLPTPCLVLDPSLRILDCNTAFLAVTGRCRDGLLGRELFEAFPDLDPRGSGQDHVRRTLEQALHTGRSALLGAQRYDISPTGDPADRQVRYWSTTAVPLMGPDGGVAAVVYNVHDVTSLAEGIETRDGHPRVRELFRAAVEVTEQARLFDDAVVAERQLGLAVQDAMLPARVPALLADRVAVRYRPASGVLHVGGDWYDATQLDDHRFAVAVGDVVGHGLGAAVLMGQLRAALNALTLADLGPAEALAALDRFARQDRDATATTAVKIIIDLQQRTLTYSSAGHPPGLLLHPDSTVEFLDGASGGALALPADPRPRPTGRAGFEPGARLVLYTDGLIERRDEDLSDSMDKFARRLCRTADQPLEELADCLLEEHAADQTDDIALLLVQL
jgi:serine phosphatase RsbU (regulator of sigma subunit)